MDKRARARQLAAEYLAKGDAKAWFEQLIGKRKSPRQPRVRADTPSRNLRSLSSIKNFMLMNRIGTVEDSANAAEYLASDLASFVSGQHLLLSGGPA